MLKKIIFIVSLIVMPLIAEMLSRVITMEMIINVMYIILGLGFLYVVKEELL